MSKDLHTALKTNIVRDFNEGGIHYKQVTLQYSKDRIVETLHACPRAFTTSGTQLTDFLALVGFSRYPCVFHHGDAYCREIMPSNDIVGMSKAITTSFRLFGEAARRLEACGLILPQPEGWGFFTGKPHEHRRGSYISGDGHTASKIERLKESQDEFFRYILTWIDAGERKGWTTHYRAKQMPLASEFKAALDFLGGFSWFQECPEFNFDGCWWRFNPRKKSGDWVRDERLVDAVHGYFDAHALHFSQGLNLLLSAHAALEPFGISFLSMPSPAHVPTSVLHPTPQPGSRQALDRPYQLEMPRQFDVAISFAGTERHLAEELAKRVRSAGYEVFYDEFYPVQLWGKDLVVFFDNIYRKVSRYCVMFVSREYADRMWTIHERRSAQARALTEKGNEYILPIRVDNTELDGLHSTTGYLSIEQYAIARIADMLILKLKNPSTPKP